MNLAVSVRRQAEKGRDLFQNPGPILVRLLFENGASSAVSRHATIPTFRCVGVLSVWCGWDRTARKRIISVVDERTEEESVMNDVIETTDNGSFAALRGDEQRTFLLLLATRDAKNIETGAREEAAINAEAILTQADEALVLG